MGSWKEGEKLSKCLPCKSVMHPLYLTWKRLLLEDLSVL